MTQNHLSKPTETLVSLTEELRELAEWYGQGCQSNPKLSDAAKAFAIGAAARITSILEAHEVREP